VRATAGFLSQPSGMISSGSLPPVPRIKEVRFLVGLVGKVVFYTNIDITANDTFR